MNKQKKTRTGRIIDMLIYIFILLSGIFLGFNIQSELGWDGIYLSIFMLLLGFLWGKGSFKSNKGKKQDEKTKKG